MSERLDVPADALVDHVLERMVLDRTSIARILDVEVSVLHRAGDVLAVHGSDGQVRLTSTLSDTTLVLLLRELADAVENGLDEVEGGPA